MLFCWNYVLTLNLFTIFRFVFNLLIIYFCVLFRFRFLFCYVVVDITHKHCIDDACNADTNYLHQIPYWSTINYCMNIDGQPSKWSKCQFCKLVITSVNLWRHIRTQHTEHSPRQCEHCQKKFKNKYSLREHVRIAHENASKPGTATT